jgi:hypothetical protein
MLNWGRSGSTIVRITSAERGNFFQPLKLHRFGRLSTGFRPFQLPSRSGVLAGNYASPFFQKLFLPGAYLIRVHVIFAGNLVDRSESFGCFQRNTELESVIVLTTFLGHFRLSTSTQIIARSLSDAGGDRQEIEAGR